MAQKETNISTRMSLMASTVGTVLFRNNVGNGLVISGKNSNKVIEACIKLVEKAGCFAYRLAFGFGVGSSDKIGYTPIVITQEMVGKKIAVFTAVEVKTKTGVVSDKQKDFLGQVKYAGGIAILYRDGDDIIKKLKGYKFT